MLVLFVITQNYIGNELMSRLAVEHTATIHRRKI